MLKLGLAAAGFMRELRPPGSLPVKFELSGGLSMSVTI